MNLNKTTKVSTKQEATPFGNVLLPVVFSTVFEQYEFKGWLITIENYCGTEELIGFATPTKYAHLLNADNYYYIDEIAEENKMLNCIIEDDGIGRKTKEKSNYKSYGMSITKERLAILNNIKNTNAQVNLIDLDKGTKVEVKLPLEIKPD